MRGTSFRRERFAGCSRSRLGTMRGEANYEVDREAWGLLRKASEIGDPESGAEQPPTAQSAQRRAQAGGNGWRRQRTTSSGNRSAAVSFRRRQRERGTIPVSVHPAVHIRTLVTRPSWTSPPEFVPAEGFLLRYVSFQTAWRVRGAPGNLFAVFLGLPQGSLILHSFFTTVRGFCVAVRDDLAESGCIET